jgi:hypothetical protein
VNLSQLQAPNKTVSRTPFLKKLFWAYFLLLIFEGALRKWILPQFAAPLLIVRDPVALLIIWEAYRTRKWPAKWTPIIGALSLGLILLAVLQLTVGETPWFVILYGLRSYLLPFPVAFIMGENLDENDLRAFGNWTLLLLIPLTALEVMQYLTPSGSIWNAGAGVGAGQIDSAGGHVRASATFSFASGPAFYLPMAAGFMFYGLVKSDFAKRWLLWMAAAAIVLSIPLTGSRTVVYEMAEVLACIAIAALFGASQFGKVIQLILPLLAIAFLVSLLPVFSAATDTLRERWSNAASVEGSTQDSLVSRVLDPITMPIQRAAETSDWLGSGMGYGSNVASTLLTGTATFLAGEAEVERVLTEFGPIAGIAFMAIRWFLALFILAKALSSMRDQQPLAWLLIPFTFINLATGLLEVPTSQGFAVCGIAFSLAAINLRSAARYSVQASSLLNHFSNFRKVRG